MWGITGSVLVPVDFCAWWLREVTLHQGDNRYSSSDRSVTAKFVTEWKKTVERWNKYLETKERYRRRLLGAEYRAASIRIFNYRMLKKAVVIYFRYCKWAELAVSVYYSLRYKPSPAGEVTRKEDL